MSIRSDFHADMRSGEQIETQVAKRLGLTGDWKTSMKDRHLGDIWVENLPAGDGLIEVKADKMFDKYRNVCFETMDATKDAVQLTGALKHICQEMPALMVHVLGGANGLSDSTDVLLYTPLAGLEVLMDPKVPSWGTTWKNGQRRAGASTGGILVSIADLRGPATESDSMAVVPAAELADAVAELWPVVVADWKTERDAWPVERLVETGQFLAKKYGKPQMKALVDIEDWTVKGR